MAIPLYGVEAHGGRIVTLDDDAVEQDLANSSGVGGNDYDCYVISTPFVGEGWGTFRRAVQHVHHDGAVTVETTPIRDEQETGQTITDSLAIGDNYVVTAPLLVSGSSFAVKVALSDFDAPAELGRAEQWVVPRRRER